LPGRSRRRPAGLATPSRRGGAGGAPASSRRRRCCRARA
jgi:hypothetical protein